MSSSRDAAAAFPYNATTLACDILEAVHDARALTRIDAMPTVLILTFRGVARSSAIDCLARDFNERLQRCDHRIHRCHFTFECNSPVDGSAALFGVKMHVSLPTAQIHADSALSCGMGHGDILEAVRSAYANVKRQLEGLQREQVDQRPATPSPVRVPAPSRSIRVSQGSR